MKNYYCPYCNSKYQINKKSKNEILLCCLCGDPLVKKPFIKINQIVAIAACLALIFPLFYTFIFIIRNQINPPKRNYQASIKSVKKESKLKISQPLQRDFSKQE